jgi:hypothetical protein
VQAEAPEPPAPLPALPPPEVRTESASPGGGFVPAVPGQATEAPTALTPFFDAHPTLSAFTAGLVGDRLAVVLNGRPMGGEEQTAMFGFLARLGAMLLAAGLAFHLMLRRQDRMAETAMPGPARRRREPTFDKGEAVATEGRREPTL